MLWTHLCVVLALLASIWSVEAVKTVTVQASYPRSLPSLSLRGNDQCGLNWSKGIPMKLISSSPTQANQTTSPEASSGYTWSVELSCADSVTALEVKVLVDDKTWMLGANHHLTISSSNNIIDHIYPYFYTYKGTLSIVSRVYSSELNNFRDVIFYLPPSYQENTLKVHRNVLIMHDGQNLFDPKTSAFGTAWMCQDTLDSMIIEGKMDEVVIAGAYNTVDRNNEYTYIYDPSEGFGGKGDLYLNWLESTLIPLIGKNYRVNLVRESLGILGSSLGGLISCYAGWTRAKTYGKVGCMSSSFWWDDNDFQNNVIVKNDIDKSNALPVFYMDSGTRGGDESCAVYTTQVYDYYQTKGFVADQTVFKYIDQGGSHNEASWGARFYLPMQDLYPATTV